MTFRATHRVPDRAPALRRKAVRRLLSVGFLAGAVLLSSTVPAGAAEPPTRGARPAAANNKDIQKKQAKQNTPATPARQVADQKEPAKAALPTRPADVGGSALSPALRALLDAVGEFVSQADVPVAPIPAKKAVKSCRGAGDGDVPTVVAAIFRCRLREAGYSDQEVSQWTAESVLVSQCESKWDPNIVVFNGRYVDTPHPRTGYRYSAAGVFQFIRKTADKWIEGGYANVKKPRYNIDAAARLFIHNRQRGMKGWEDWACAAANDGFKVGSVLPNYPGGPSKLPDWVWQY